MPPLALLSLQLHIVCCTLHNDGLRLSPGNALYTVEVSVVGVEDL